MNRLEQLRQVIDQIVRQNPDPDESRCGFVHLYGVSAICTILALKRGLDPEVCSVAGMLHDIWNYQVEDSPEHGQLGAAESEKILLSLGSFSSTEIQMVYDAIARHENKEGIDGEMDELLKDADVFQHYLYNPRLFDNTANRFPGQNPQMKPARIKRLEKVLIELGISSA